MCFFTDIGVLNTNLKYPTANHFGLDADFYCRGKRNEFQNLFDKSKKLIDSARSNMGQMANAITVLTSFLLGRYIIEQEQQGSERAKYGAKVLDSLSSYLTEEYGRGFSRSNVAGMRQFYMAYKDREDEIIQSGIGQLETAYKKIPFKLSWTHYQILMRIEDKDERDFYEKEAIRSYWNVSTLKRQFHSSFTYSVCTGICRAGG